MASWITSSKVNFKPDSSHTATGWIAVYQDSITTSNTSVTITGHINLYSTKDPPSWYGTFSSSSTNITSNKGTVTKSLPNKSFTTNRSTKYHNEQIGTFTITIPRGTVAQTATISVSSSITITSSDFSGKSATGTVTGSATVSVPVLQSYAVSYDANSGSGAPTAQTKYYGINLTLSSVAPAKDGYKFIGWATSAERAAVPEIDYSSGGTYSGNAALALFAIWELAYTKPVITNLSVERCTSDGALVDEGKYAKVSFNWSIYRSADARYYGGDTYPYANNSVSNCTITVGSQTLTLTLTGASGSESKVIGNGSFDTDTQYDVSVSITDSQIIEAQNTTTITGVLATTRFPLDFNADASTMGVFRPAPDNGDGAYFGKDVHVNGDVSATSLTSELIEDNGEYTGGINDEALLTTDTINKWKTILGI